MAERVVYMSESAAQSILSASSLSHPVETGGVLIGVRAGTNIWVTHAVELASRARGPASYEIPEGATKAMVREFRTQDGRLGYVGDWHSHPMNLRASAIDRATAIRTGKHLRQQTLLLVARRWGGSYELDVYQVRGLALRECSITFAGDLPQHANEGNDDA